HRQLAAALAAACLATGAAAGANAPPVEPIKPLPATVTVDRPKAELGKALFFDRRFSKDNSVSCASCHAFDKGGAYAAVRPTGAGRKEHALNSPSVFNVAFNFRQLWSGGQDSVEGVVDAVVKSPSVFASSWPEVLGKLSADAALQARFKQTYPAGMTRESVSHAIGEYTRSLITPNARFDQYLRGNTNAINAEERAGYDLFKKYGCVACHQGVNVGGNMFQKFGVMGDYFTARGNVKPADYGRFNVTKREADRYVFKVPSLRNVALTAPYFHDGSAATLPEAVQVMFVYQLGRPASAQDVELIVKFLGTLSGEAPKEPK
ncbi:MAG TPA: cytochrome c peroxidase, partial [Ramlibacter sp.]|nr:cytochrome c peroxidase [Ramlibacter sp.]